MSAASNPTEMARVLPLLEKLLCQAGLMRATWAEHWQHSWQRATSYSVDWKHALLLTASLQVSMSLPHSLPSALLWENSRHSRQQAVSIIWNGGSFGTDLVAPV